MYITQYIYTLTPVCGFGLILSLFMVFDDKMNKNRLVKMLILPQIWILTLSCRVVSKCLCPVNNILLNKKSTSPQYAKHCGIFEYVY